MPLCEKTTKKNILVITAADEDKTMMESTIAGLRGFMRDCMEGSVERGVIYGKNC